MCYDMLIGNIPHYHITWFDPTQLLYARAFRAGKPVYMSHDPGLSTGLFYSWVFSKINENVSLLTHFKTSNGKIINRGAHEMGKKTENQLQIPTLWHISHFDQISTLWHFSHMNLFSDSTTNSAQGPAGQEGRWDPQPYPSPCQAQPRATTSS